MFSVTPLQTACCSVPGDQPEFILRWLKSQGKAGCNPVQLEQSTRAEQEPHSFSSVLMEMFPVGEGLLEEGSGFY